jgi:hypothetical protein
MKIYIQTTTVSSSEKQQYALRINAFGTKFFKKSGRAKKIKQINETYKYILPPVLSQIHIFDK